MLRLNKSIAWRVPVVKSGFDGDLMTVVLTLVSHGATTASLRAAFPADDSLLDNKVPMMAPAGWRSRHCICSPMAACLQMAQHFGLQARVEPDLRDLDHGRWSGIEIAAVAQSTPEALELWVNQPAFRDHGGESRDQLADRMAAWLDRVASDGNHVVAITHSAVIRSIVCRVLGAPPTAFWLIDIAPGTVTDLRHDGRRWALRRLNCAG
ncbi:histidine phosphatase family protein [Pseudotabrizicola sediminis]|uniref:Histidine phosphatase family protein n=2 Tax=Pseudotabrizicola sediminis TaxID=2486418 RepID=A0ABY2KJG8_9RHOB|nr:histidine phosphatase family protein [Pseudotabrizicola sediminis]